MLGNGISSNIQRRLLDREEQQGINSRSAGPFAQLSQQMKDLAGDGGVLKQIVQPGNGPTVPPYASVLMHYSGFLEYSDRPFETSTNSKYPRMMKLGGDLNLAGLALGLLTMKIGEFSRFLFHPKYAYGDMGCPPLIPGDALILYEVQVVDFLDSGQVDDFVALSPAEQNDVALPALVEVVNTLRGFGNRCFNQTRYEYAIDRYKQAVTLLRNRETQSDEEREKVNASFLPLYLNLSVTQLHLDSPHKALKYANKALEIDPTNTKALFRCGKAYVVLHEFEKAQGCLIRAQAKKPFDPDINNLLREAATCYKESLDKQKDMCTKMCKDFRRESL